MEEVFIASGRDFPDALAGAARAARDDAPVLLVTPTSVPAATATYLADHAPISITLLGGTGAVSAQVEQDLTHYGPVRRVAGRDRYETAAALVGDLPSAGAAWVAGGQAWPDALAAAARAAATDEPLLLTRRGDVPVPTRLELGRLDPDLVRITGGETVVAEEVRAELEQLR